MDNIRQQGVPRGARNGKEKTTTRTTRDNKRFLAELGTNIFYHEPLARRSQLHEPLARRSQYTRIGFLAELGMERRKRQQKQHKTTRNNKRVPRIARNEYFLPRTFSSA